MKQRPTSISVIAWILIVIGGISLITTTAMINHPMVHNLMSKSSLSVSAQYAISYLGLLITIISGVAMLKGKNWARFLYVIWSLIGFVIGLTTSPMKMAMIPGFIVFSVIAFFLFRPKANEFFGPVWESGDA